MSTVHETSWDYALSQITQNKKGKRTSVPKGTAFELAGFDGSVDGGLRPFRGFRQVTDLEYGYGGPQNSGGTMQGFFPFRCQVDNTTFAYGFLYRVEGTGVNLGKVMYRLKYRIGDGSTWQYDRDHGFSLGLLGIETGFNVDQVMQIVEVGRFVYVLRKGKDPFMFYFTCEGTESSSGGGGTSSCSEQGYRLIVLTDLGPGDAPKWADTAITGFSAFEFAQNFTPFTHTQYHPDMGAALTTMPSPTNGEAAKARMVACGFTGVSHVEGTNPPFHITNPHLDVIDPAAGMANACPGPSEMRDENDVLLWASPLQTDPAFYTIVVWTGGSVVQPAYVDADNGWGHNLSSWEPDTARGIVSFISVLAYQLWDSRTGRFSALSELLSYSLPQGGSSCVNEVQKGSVTQDSRLGIVSFPMIQIIYDTTKYDTILVYRGTSGSSLEPNQQVLSLEAQLTLSDYHIDVQPGGDYKIAGYFFQLGTTELATQEKYDGSYAFLADFPKAGAGIFLEGSMFIGNITPTAIEDSDIGLVRWSSPYRINVELFDPADKYPLLSPTEQVSRFVRVGPNIIGLGSLAQYLLRKETTFIKGFTVHGGYGITNHRAACEVGTMVYLVTRHGVKTLRQDKQAAAVLSDLESLNGLIKEEWIDDLEFIELEYDAQLGAIILHNPVQEISVFLWLETSMITEIKDSMFLHVSRGLIPVDRDTGVNDVTNPLEDRAVFVSEVEIELGAGEFNIWRVWTADLRRENATLGLLEHTATDPRFSISVSSASSSSSNEFTVLDPGFTPTRAMQLEGTYVYVLDGEHEGDKAKVRYLRFSDSLLVLDRALAVNDGDRVGISPVYCEFTGHAVGLETKEGFVFAKDDIFRVRQPEQIRCHFVDVAGPAATDDTNKDARFKGQLYKGNNLEILGGDFPKGISGKTDDERKVISVADGPSQIPAAFGDLHGQHAAVCFPSIKIICPELDFRLLGVRVDGKITAATQEDVPNTT